MIDIDTLQKLDSDMSESIEFLNRKKENSKPGSKAQEAYMYGAYEVRCLQDKLRTIIVSNTEKK